MAWVATLVALRSPLPPQWARANGCPWNELTCYEAVENFDAEMLRWARENGCPWDEETRIIALEELGYEDNFGNVVRTNIDFQVRGNGDVRVSDEFSDEYSDEYSDEEH